MNSDFDAKEIGFIFVSIKCDIGQLNPLVYEYRKKFLKKKNRPVAELWFSKSTHFNPKKCTHRVMAQSVELKERNQLKIKFPPKLLMFYKEYTKHSSICCYLTLRHKKYGVERNGPLQVAYGRSENYVKNFKKENTFRLDLKSKQTCRICGSFKFRYESGDESRFPECVPSYPDEFDMFGIYGLYQLGGIRYEDYLARNYENQPQKWRKALIEAIDYNKPEIIQFIRKQGVVEILINEDLVEYNSQKKTFLFYVIESQKSLEVLNEILKFKNINVNLLFDKRKNRMIVDKSKLARIDWNKLARKKLCKYEHLLHICVRERERDFIHCLLRAGADVNCLKPSVIGKSKDKHESYRIEALSVCSLRLLERLLDNKDDNFHNRKIGKANKNFELCTPLMNMLKHQGNHHDLREVKEVIKLFISKGCDLNQVCHGMCRNSEGEESPYKGESQRFHRKCCLSIVMFRYHHEIFKFILPYVSEEIVHGCFTDNYGVIERDIRTSRNNLNYLTNHIVLKLPTSKKMFKSILKYVKRKQNLFEMLYTGLVVKRLLNVEFYDALVERGATACFLNRHELHKSIDLFDRAVKNYQYFVNVPIQYKYMDKDEEKIGWLTPLLYFVKTNNVDCVKTLVNNNYSNCYGEVTKKKKHTGLHVATIMKNEEIIKTFLEKDPKLMFVKNEKGKFAVKYAQKANRKVKDLYAGHMEVLKGEMTYVGEAIKVPVYDIEFTVSARNLDAKDLDGKSDPFFTISLGKEKVLKSDVIKNTLNPDWGSFKLHIDHPCWDEHSRFFCAVYDHDMLLKNEVIGCFEFSINDLITAKEQKIGRDVYNLEKVSRINEMMLKKIGKKKYDIYHNSGRMEIVLKNFVTTQVYKRNDILYYLDEELIKFD